MKKQRELKISNYNTQVAGKIHEEIENLLQIDVNEYEILLYPGVIKHIKKRHTYAFKNYFKKIVEIISQPDFIGRSTENKNRFEFIKKYKDNVLLAMKVNENKQIFISSMYIIEGNRIEHRINDGRLIDMKNKLTISKPLKSRYKNKSRGSRR
ncbi:MAG: PBECR2 nuclease fold domain-containing protein [Cellulosilyticaceae bacterium]